jgi:hypothetical protein
MSIPLSWPFLRDKIPNRYYAFKTPKHRDQKCFILSAPDLIYLFENVLDEKLDKPKEKREIKENRGK